MLGSNSSSSFCEGAPSEHSTGGATIIPTTSIIKVMLSVGRAIHEVDALRIGKRELWLVPQWRRGPPPARLSKPEWMIRVDDLRHFPMGNILVLIEPMPVPVFRGESTKGYTVQFNPEILVHL